MTIGAGEPFTLGETVCTGVGNSVNGAGDITGIGSVVASSYTLTLRTQNLPPSTFGFYNTSRGDGFVPNPGGSLGNLCVTAPPIGRFTGPGQIIYSGPTGTSDLSLDLTAFSQANGTVAVQAGDTSFFQLWYRDVDSNGNAASNFSSALRVRFE